MSTAQPRTTVPLPSPAHRARTGRVISVLLPRTDRAPSAARRIVEAGTRVWGADPGTTDAVRLIVSELVTNAVRHTDGPWVALTVLLLGRRQCIKVIVLDTGPRPRGPVPLRSSGATDENGRGLSLVAALSTHRGHRRVGRGSAFWALVPVTRRP